MILDSAAEYVGRRKSVLMNEKGRISSLQHPKKTLKEVFDGLAAVGSMPRDGVTVTSCVTRTAGGHFVENP
jgi:hypothetical protein